VAGSAGRVVRAGVVALLLLLAPSGVWGAGEPTDRIRGAIDRAIGILKDPQLQGPEKRERRKELLRREIEPAFDFEEMSRRSLGPEWRGRTEPERKEFVSLFTELLANSYLGKIEAYEGEEIRYVKETVDLPYAQVETRVVTKRGQEFPVNYRMRRGDGGWRIYDVVIEGISLVNNYRSQFQSLLRKSSFEAMLERLRTTVREQSS
jgi:phospholipid transport system substrate-binding protein